MRSFLFAFFMVAAPGLALAAGSEDDSPPQPTATTTTCEEGLIWDEEAKACVAPKESSLDDDALYGAVRELAYAGKLRGAEIVLDAMSDQTDGRVLTYRGFLARQGGDWTTARDFYLQAIANDPGNLLARSYYGQGLAESGDTGAARAQLSEIRARGGRNTWAEASLNLALSSGTTKAY